MVVRLDGIQFRVSHCSDVRTDSMSVHVSAIWLCCFETTNIRVPRIWLLSFFTWLIAKGKPRGPFQYLQAARDAAKAAQLLGDHKHTVLYLSLALRCLENFEKADSGDGKGWPSNLQEQRLECLLTRSQSQAELGLLKQVLAHMRTESFLSCQQPSPLSVTVHSPSFHCHTQLMLV